MSVFSGFGGTGQGSIGTLGNTAGPPNNGDALGPSPSAQPNAEQSPFDVLPESKPFEDVSVTDDEQKVLNSLSQIVSTVTTRYQRARETRRPQELIWLRNMHQWRGEYNEDEKARIAVAKARSKEASDVFIKITKTKTVSAIGQIEDILFSGNKFPLEITSPEEPKGIAKEVFIVPQQFPLDDPYGYNGDGQTLDPGATKTSLLGGLADKFQKLLQGKKVEEGQSPDPKQFPQLNPAEECAKKMEKYILDQMADGKVAAEVRKSVWECAVFGTGVIKGPETYSNTLHTWKKVDGKNQYSPTVEDVPRSKFVSIWNFYPDPNATRVENCSFICEKHLMTPWQVAELKRYPAFDENAIERVLRNRAVRTRDYWENQIKDISVTVTDERYEVIEYWGYLERDHIQYLPDIDKEELAKAVNQVQVNVWICNDQVLRVILNPFVPQRLPYYAIPYEEHEYQIWGVGIPENMRDPQKIMNGHWRMLIDNLRFAGSVMLEVNENQLVPNQDLTIFPGKVWRKQGGVSGQSIYAINVPSTAQEHMQAFDKARQLADEATGQPSFAQGQAIGQTGVRTASQTQMLLSQASGNIKQVIRNFDEYLLEPMGTAYFNWNMQHNDDAEVKGPIKIVAKGTSALMQKEIQSQRLLQFLQILSSNPALAPFGNFNYILRQLALSLDLDPEKLVNNMEDAQLFAQLIGQMQQAQTPVEPGQQGVQQQTPQQSAGPMNPSDQSASQGGNTTVNPPPNPQSQQFSG